MRGDIIRYLVLGGVFLVIFVPLGLLPMLEKGPAKYEAPNPSPEQWIGAAHAITVPPSQMTVKQLQITGTAMHLENSQNIVAAMHDLFSNLKGIGWCAVGILAALAINQFVFVR